MTRTYLQGSFRATAAATIRLTDDPTGSPSTSDWTVAEGDTWNSADELLAEWSAQLVSDLGNGHYVSAVGDTGELRATCAVTMRLGTNWSIAWSSSGDGTDLRDWLGSTGDLTNQASGGTFQSYIPASFCPPQAAISARRVRSTRAHGRMLKLDGTTQTQHSTSTADIDSTQLSVDLMWGAEGVALGTYKGHQRWEAFVDAVFGEAGGGEPWSLFHGLSGDEDQWVCRWQSNRMMEHIPMPVDQSRQSQLYSLQFTADVEVAPW